MDFFFFLISRPRSPSGGSFPYYKDAVSSDRARLVVCLGERNFSRTLCVPILDGHGSVQNFNYIWNDAARIKERRICNKWALSALLFFVYTSTTSSTATTDWNLRPSFEKKKKKLGFPRKKKSYFFFSSSHVRSRRSVGFCNSRHCLHKISSHIFSKSACARSAFAGC